MHELSVAESILDIVQQRALEHRATRVLSLVIHVGELSAVVADALRFAFEVLARDTCAKDARLEIVLIPWRVECPACATNYQVSNGMPSCPACGSGGGRVLSGRELALMEMNIE